MAHITGGGLLENIPRVIAKNLSVKLDLSSWEMPEIFKWLQKEGNINNTEMLRVFNCGVGMVIIVSQNESHKVIKSLTNIGEEAWLIGKVFQSNKNNVII